MTRRRYKSLADRARALPPYCTARDICRLFGISESTIYREARRGWPALPSPLPHVGNAIYKWLTDDIIEWLEHKDERRVVASSKPGPRMIPSPRKVAS